MSGAPPLPEPRSAPLIELAGITKEFVTGGGTVPALRGVSLRIHAGEFVAIVGASGSGKTTLMNVLGCLDQPSGGHYRFRGRDVSALGRDEQAALRRDEFGFVFQGYNLIPALTAAENVEIPAVYAGVDAGARGRRARALLARLGLGERADHRPNQLSGGQQQRVSIARALMNGGAVILADEPTGALDSRTGAEVIALLRELAREGHTVILITHDASVAAAADRRVEIKDGVVVADSGAASAPSSPRPAPPPGRGAALADLGEAVKMAVRSLRANLFRTLLTLLGIVIGTGAVIVMLAVGNGARQDVVDRLAAMGTDLLLVRPGAPGFRGADGVATLTPADAEAVARLDNVKAVLAEISGRVTVRHGNADYQTTASAVNETLPGVKAWALAQGTFFGAEEATGHVPVAVLGQTVVANLFPPGVDPVGRYVLIKNVPFQVIGVLAAKGATPWGQDQDDAVFVPLSTGSLRLFGQRHLQALTVQVADTAASDDTQAALAALLKERHRAEDAQIRNTASLLETVEKTQGTLTVLLGSIAAVSLLVGGIGVMNIMLVSVTERTREIGIRAATGATAANIMQQFVTEALAVSALGGALGVLGGQAVVWGLGALGVAVASSAGPVLLAFSSAFGVGLAFGWMPARKAARLEPVTALGAE